MFNKLNEYDIRLYEIIASSYFIDCVNISFEILFNEWIEKK